MLLIISLLLIAMMGYQMYLIRKYKAQNKSEMSYIATLTHDLKSPAHAQLNMLNMILKGQFGELNPKQYEMIKLTRSSAKYMSNLVGTVLTDYRYKLSCAQIRKTRFDIVNVINSILKENELLIEEKELNILFDYPIEGCIICADKLQIERAVINLITNAISYSLENSSLLIKLYCEKEQIKFSVSNKSRYIKPKELKNIFNKFSKTINSSMNKASTGLGLFSAKQIITMHKGEMFAQSSTDGICTFGFWLPTGKIDKKEFAETL